jgi:hypothetical protein
VVLLQPTARLEWLYDVAAISAMLAALARVGLSPLAASSERQFSLWRKKRPLKDLEQAGLPLSQFAGSGPISVAKTAAGIAG